jgi:hypothetical protein
VSALSIGVHDRLLENHTPSSQPRTVAYIRNRGTIQASHARETRPQARAGRQAHSVLRSRLQTSDAWEGLSRGAGVSVAQLLMPQRLTRSQTRQRHRPPLPHPARHAHRHRSRDRRRGHKRRAQNSRHPARRARRAPRPRARRTKSGTALEAPPRELSVHGRGWVPEPVLPVRAELGDWVWEFDEDFGVSDHHAPITKTFGKLDAS